MVFASQRLFATPGAVRVFLARRIARIVPLYWATTTVFLLVAALLPQLLNSPAPTLPEVVSAYLFYPLRRTDGLVQPVFSLGWSLNYEMYFYAVFALALLFTRVKGVVLVAVFFALSVLTGWLIGPRSVAIAFWTSPIVLEFVAGALLALLYLNGVRMHWSVSIAVGAAALAMLHF